MKYVSEEPMKMNSHNLKPGAWKLFRIWGGIGLQSFGGGTSTTYLIYHTFVDRYHWLLPEEYNRLWNLSVMAPGSNILALTLLIGRTLGGVRGLLASLAGLLIPCATITCLLTAGFLNIQHFPAAQAMVRGVVSATAGITLVVAIRYAQPLIKELRTEGLGRLIRGLSITTLVILALLLFQVPVALVMVSAVLLSILVFVNPPPRPGPAQALGEKEKVSEESHD
jgi:chromate transporter